jgi:hypothetical protein
MQTVVTTDGTGVSVVSTSLDNRTAISEKEAPAGIARISDAFSRPTLRVARIDTPGGREPRGRRRIVGAKRDRDARRVAAA